MNAASHLQVLFRRLIALAMLALSALLMSGCDNFEEEVIESVEEGQPVQGIYEVSVSPAAVGISAANPSTVVDLNVTAIGPYLPLNWESHPPGWFANGADISFQTVIANPNSRSTQLTITYTGAPTPPSDPNPNWTFSTDDTYFGIGTESAPEGMTIGGAILFVRYHYGPDVDEEIAEKPRLSIWPAGGGFSPGMTRTFKVTYKGPDTNYSNVGATPTGPNGFSWNVSIPDLKDGVSFPVAITYHISAPPVTGDFHLSTSNGASITIPLKGLP